MFNNNDLQLLQARGIAPAQVEKQLQRFATGFPFLRLAGSATLGRGIEDLSAEQEDAAIARWQKYLADGGEVEKFVPASGAASRMFKALFAFVDGPDAVAAEG